MNMAIAGFTPIQNGEQNTNMWVEDTTFDIEFQVVTPVTIQQNEQQEHMKEFDFQEVIPYSLQDDVQVFFIERTSTETATIVIEELLGYTAENYRVVRRRRSKVTKRSRQVFLINIDSKRLMRMTRRRQDIGIFKKKKPRRDSWMSL